MSFHRATALVGACAALAVPFVACSETHFDTLCDLHPEQCCDLDPTLPGCGDVGAEASTEGGETSTEGGTDADAAADADADADAPTETGPLCTKGEIRCTGPDLEQCATDGMSWLKLTTCPSASTCDAKAGRCTACTPDAYRCDGAKRLQCDKLGKTEAEVATCDTLELCVASTGATCAKAACAVGEKKCEGAKAMVCNAGRTGFDSTTCASAALCAAGVCTSPSCSAAEKRCSGKKVQTCKADLTGWDDTETCAIDCDGGTSPACLKVTQLASRTQHVCAVLSNGTVRCWGNNANEQSVPGGAAEILKPTVVPGVTGISQLSVSEGKTVGLRKDGSTIQWGLGAPSPISTGISLTVSAIDVSNGHICFRAADSLVRCYGTNTSLELGGGTLGTAVPVSSPIAVTGSSGGGMVSVSETNSLAAVSGGILAWGQNSSGALASGSFDATQAPALVYVGMGKAMLSAFGASSCAWGSGSVLCSGAGETGALGNGSTASTSTPVSVTGVSGVTEVAVGAFHACAVQADGAVKCWGKNEYGELGDGTTSLRSAPVLAIGSGGKKVTAGWGLTCVLQTDDTTVQCWGRNYAGALGVNLTSGSLPSRASPAPVVW